MNALEAAIRRGDWERAALYLLLGLQRAANRLPPETLDALLTLLADESREKRHAR
jgi:hypothetical protein